MVVEQARAIASEGRLRAGQRVHAFGQRQGSGLSGSQIVQVDIGIAVDVGGPGDGLAVGRKIAAFDFPFVLGEPIDFLGGDIQQADVVIAVAGIRGDQQMLSVGREIVGGVKLFALVRRQQRALAGGNFGDEDIGIRALGLLLGVGDPLAVGGPDGIDIHLVLGRAGGQVLGVAHQRVEDIDLVHRRRLRLHRVSQIAAVRATRSDSLPRSRAYW